MRSFGSDMGGRRATTIGEGGEIMGNKDWAGVLSRRMGENDGSICVTEDGMEGGTKSGGDHVLNLGI